jgi:DNA transformation protein
MPVSPDFADFCCELLCSVGSLRKRRMFGGYGLSVDGLTIALVTDLGSGDKLWLKADADSRTRFEDAGCERFSYDMRQGDALVARGLNYYCPPADAMDAAHAMAPWARLAMESALKARAAADQKAAARASAKVQRPRKTVAAAKKTTKGAKAPKASPARKPAPGRQG